MNKETHANTSNVSVQECSICGPYEIKADGLVDVSDCFHYGGNRQPPAIEQAAVEKAFERLRMRMGPRPADKTVRASIATILEEYGETE